MDAFDRPMRALKDYGDARAVALDTANSYERARLLAVQSPAVQAGKNAEVRDAAAAEFEAGGKTVRQWKEDAQASELRASLLFQTYLVELERAKALPIAAA